MKFFDGLDDHLKDLLKDKLRDLWTHSSTAIEGNTLSLGETHFLLTEGLTIQGKPLKDHQEVFGHAKAIELIYGLLNKSTITENDLFDLHKAVLVDVVLDYYKPIGAWKNEDNSTLVRDPETDKLKEHVYPSYTATPKLMKEWLDSFNFWNKDNLAKHVALEGYAKQHKSFAKIHPFFDGNGRIARLISNIPVLKSGFPPILIPVERRKEYIEKIHSSVEFHVFRDFCEDCWKETLDIVEQIHKMQDSGNQLSATSEITSKISNPTLKRLLRKPLKYFRDRENLNKQVATGKIDSEIKKLKMMKELFDLQERDAVTEVKKYLDSEYNNISQEDRKTALSLLKNRQ